MAVNITDQQQSSHPACAACRYQRKKCVPDCILRRHFPASNSDGFAAVHKVFGVANVIKMMREANSLANQDELARSLNWEAAAWARDPIRGPYGAFLLLQEEIRVLREELSRHQPMHLPMLPPPPPPPGVVVNNMPTDQYYYNINIPPQQMPMSFPRQFQGQGSLIKEDYDRIRVPAGNGAIGLPPESSVRVPANNLQWRQQQQHQQFTSPQHDYKMR